MEQRLNDELRHKLLSYDLTNNLFMLYEAVKIAEKILTRNEFPAAEFERYLKNGGKI